MRRILTNKYKLFFFRTEKKRLNKKEERERERERRKQKSSTHHNELTLNLLYDLDIFLQRREQKVHTRTQ